MNPFDLSASDLLIWGVVLHLIADWPLQNDWMARNKAWPWGNTVEKLLAPAMHAAIHATLLGVVFGFWPGLALGAAHLFIDTRIPVVWWSRLIRQTQPADEPHFLVYWIARKEHTIEDAEDAAPGAPMLVDVGTMVRFWTDQVFHIACVAAAALVVAA